MLDDVQLVETKNGSTMGFCRVLLLRREGVGSTSRLSGRGPVNAGVSFCAVDEKGTIGLRVKASPGRNESGL